MKKSTLAVSTLSLFSVLVLTGGSCSKNISSYDSNENTNTTNITTTNTIETGVPTVVASFPETGAQNVDPDTTEIWVKFSEPMKDGSWTWAYAVGDQVAFPALTGDPKYSENFTKNTLPVTLKSNTEYRILVNSDGKKNFIDQDGNPATPFYLTFKTGE